MRVFSCRRQVISCCFRSVQPCLGRQVDFGLRLYDIFVESGQRMKTLSEACPRISAQSSEHLMRRACALLCADFSFVLCVGIFLMQLWFWHYSAIGLRHTHQVNPNLCGCISFLPPPTCPVAIRKGLLQFMSRVTFVCIIFPLFPSSSSSTNDAAEHNNINYK